jgi:ribA/ribD-fused uncharacterized protein
MQQIKFRFVRDEYGCFSNFYPCSIVYKDELWYTSEALYQALKFTAHPHIQEKIRFAKSPYDAKKIAREKMHLAFQMKLGVINDLILHNMEMVLNLKVEQHEFIKQKLLQTDNKEIIEVSSKDTFWGQLPSGEGLNMLGTLWMKIRQNIRK